MISTEKVNYPQVPVFIRGVVVFGSGIYGYVILKDGVCESDEEVIKGLRNIVRMQIGGFAVPEILMVNSIIHMLT